MKLLLYCCKSKPYLVNKERIEIITKRRDNIWLTGERYAYDNWVNGTILCECDYEVEEIYYGYEIDDFWTKTCGSQKDFKHNLLKQSCLEHEEMYEYLQPKDSYYGNCGYAIHIKNLHIFDEPKDLKDYYHNAHKLEKAPQNMMIVQELTKSEKYKGSYLVKDYVLISIRPEWLCKILNGEKTIEVRRKVLKEMFKNDR